ncbi:MAG: hypothetical protein GKR90_18735 [Pseudomonadales bacterium]|nr:hypothetical protein [Pseudomonadales bacterium]
MTNSNLSIRQWLSACGGFGLKPGERKFQVRVSAITLLWAITYVGASKLLVADPAPLVAALAIAIPIAISIWMIQAYLSLLSNMDEFMRGLQLEAIAWSFAIGLIALMAYALLEQIGLPPLTSNDAILLMMVAWVAGQLSTFLRHR